MAFRRLLEIPIFGPASAELATKLGAARLELNAAGSYSSGGTTPSVAELRATVAAVGRRASAYLTPTAAAVASPAAVRVMIRPRGPPDGSLPDFLYSPDEFADMREAVVRFKDSGLMDPNRGDGFVFGLLRQSASGNDDGGGPTLAVDVEKNTELVGLARPFRCVFHRAFDDVIGCHAEAHATSSWEAALEHVIQCGFDGLLTSGGPGRASENVSVLRRILRTARGRIEVVLGGGVRSTNVHGLGTGLGFLGPTAWFHSSCLTHEDRTEIVDGAEVRAIVQELGRLE